MNNEGHPHPRRHGDQVVNTDNPWPGLSSFREQDQEFFRGRGAEAAALQRLVLRDRLTVVFGSSGLGKTSLLQAGLFPKIRLEQVLPVYIRLDYTRSELNLQRQVLNSVADAAKEAEADAPESEEVATLWEYFHRQDTEFWNARNKILTPLLVFDQFEEIFTLGQSDPRHARATESLIAELADLIEGRVPASIRAHLEEYPDQAHRFSFKRHDYKILLSLREDYLAQLETLRDRIPSLAHNRLRLERMRGHAAMRVVTQVPNLVSDDVAQQIISFVAAVEDGGTGIALGDMEIEPAQLSVVCRELNNKRLVNGDATITADLLEGSRDEILADLYERSVGDLDPAVRTFVEEELLTVSGYRDSVAIENALETPEVTREAIDTLVDRRLLRIEDRGGVQRIELTHDLLTGVIRQSRDARRRREIEAHESQARKEAEEREQEALGRLKTSRRFAFVFLVLMGIAAAGAFVAFRFEAKARAAELKAREAQVKAEAAWEEAEEQRGIAKRNAEELERLILESNQQRGKIQSLSQIINGPLREVTTVRARSEPIEQGRERITDRGGRPLWVITLWVDLPDLRRHEIQRVRYFFDHPTFYPKEKTGTDPATGFAVTYTGRGCLDDVVVSIDQGAGDSTEIAFDLCEALEQETGISEFERKSSPIPKKGGG